LCADLNPSPRVFLFEIFSPLADRRQKEKFINRKSSGQPARKICVVDWVPVSRTGLNADLNPSPRVFLFEIFSPLADRRQKEKFINRKSSGQPARKICVVDWVPVSRTGLYAGLNTSLRVFLFGRFFCAGSPSAKRNSSIEKLRVSMLENLCGWLGAHVSEPGCMPMLTPPRPDRRGF
jgi:hypothetical protein